MFLTFSHGAFAFQLVMIKASVPITSSIYHFVYFSYCYSMLFNNGNVLIILLLSITSLLQMTIVGGINTASALFCKLRASLQWFILLLLLTFSSLQKEITIFYIGICFVDWCQFSGESLLMWIMVIYTHLLKHHKFNKKTEQILSKLSWQSGSYNEWWIFVRYVT